MQQVATLQHVAGFYYEGSMTNCPLILLTKPTTSIGQFVLVVGFSIYGGSMQNISNPATNRVTQLSALLQNPATVLPVFVRFQKVDQYLTIPVMDVIINGYTVEVNTSDGMHSISMESLIDIVVFRDASGMPVFLTEFSTGGDIAADYREEIEEGNRYETAQWIKHQDVYLPVNYGKSISKPMIRKQKKTEKVYQYVVTLRYAKRLAA